MQVNTSLKLTFSLHFVWPPTCVDLWEVVMTCIDFDRALITVWPPNTSQHKLIASQHLHMHGMCGFFATCIPTCESIWPPIFASSYASTGFRNLCQLALSPFIQGLGFVGLSKIFQDPPRPCQQLQLGLCQTNHSYCTSVH